MKSQQRHELQTNELADKLGIWVQRILPYSRQIILGVIAVVVIVIVALYMNNQRIARTASGWSEFFRAFAQRDPQALSEVARLHSGNPAALWAEQAAGDLQLATGAGQMFMDREEAEQSLRKAIQHYETVEQGSSIDPMLLSRARYGLAQAYETLSDTERARTYYEQVFQAEPESPLGQDAKKRFDQLSLRSTEGWYAWFDRQQPPQPEAGAGGFDPEVPDDLDSLPSAPDLSFPGATGPELAPPMTPDQPVPSDPSDPSDQSDQSDQSDADPAPAPDPSP